ncbi:hypothetical protein [Geminocystis sp. GBBB08]|uniref:hypothetical protein n=1 Tax=Geminocystis sp. GBBB08 TaxID=2604140 RepID=UPI0027E2668F|nr:hypothetical protein [Geminocystis sp. GBBB08]MBL1211502.1 hypothetical protein [Geminocystis sp. GBBB08]
MVKTSSFQQAIETVERLSLEEQEILVNLIQKRLSEQRRIMLSKEIKEIHQEIEEGKIKFGTVNDFLTELDQE